MTNDDRTIIFGHQRTMMNKKKRTWYCQEDFEYFSKLISTVRSDCVKWMDGNRLMNGDELERFFSLSKVVSKLDIDGAVIFKIPRVPDGWDRAEFVRCDDNSACWCVRFNKGSWNIVELSDSLRLCDCKSWHEAKRNCIDRVFLRAKIRLTWTRSTHIRDGLGNKMLWKNILENLINITFEFRCQVRT